MNILEKNKSLFGKEVKVTCTDSTEVFGIWSEWWDEEDNAYLADDNLPVCDSILIDGKDNLIELRITEIESIQEAHG